MLENIKSNSKVVKKFKVGENADRSHLKLPVIIIRGKEEGPSLLLNGAVHGNELVGVEIIRRVMEELRPQQVKGTLIAVPIVNLSAYNSGMRVDPLDQKDMNRQFPGDPEGSITQQLAYFFYNFLVKEADYLIDLHSAEYPDVLMPHTRIRALDPTGRSQVLSQAFGLDLVWEGKGKEGMLQVAAVEEGIAATTVEIGAGNSLDEEGIMEGVEGIKNVMRVLGMLEGMASVPEYQIYIKSNEQWLRSPQGGIFRPFVRLGEIVERGQVIGEIADPLNLKTKKMRVMHHGLIGGMRMSPVVRTGTRLFFLLHYARGGRQGIRNENLIRVSNLPNSRYVENRILKAMKGRSHNYIFRG